MKMSGPDWILLEKKTDSQKIETECFTEYEFQLVATNEVGPSRTSTETYTTKGNAIKNNERGIYTYNVQMVVIV